MHDASGPSPTRPLRSLLLAGTAALLLCVAVGMGRNGRLTTTPSLADARATVHLRFTDRSDGGVDVFEAAGGVRISEFAPTTNGFARSVLRSFVRERRRSGIGAQQPFDLVRRADGGLSLHDPATGRQVSLDAFGPDNLRVFADLLQAAQRRAYSAKL
jgi:putative photosynthetic complex assembly protein